MIDALVALDHPEECCSLLSSGDVWRELSAERRGASGDSCSTCSLQIGRCSASDWGIESCGDIGNLPCLKESVAIDVSMGGALAGCRQGKFSVS